MEQPRIAGVGGGVGTSILVAALRAIDCGIYRGGDVVDVLVARSSMYSLGCAQRAIAATPDPPILAVVAATPAATLPSSCRARLRMTEPHVAAVVMVPFVAEWLEIDNPLSDAADVLLMNPLPKPLRGFVTAIHRLVEEVTPRVLHRAARPRPLPEAVGFSSQPHLDPVGPPVASTEDSPCSPSSLPRYPTLEQSLHPAWRTSPL